MSADVIKKTNIAVKYSLFFKCSQQVVALIMGILLARILSPSEFGIIAIANMVIYYANSFTNFGLNNALVQRSSVKDVHINTVFTLDLIISLSLGMLTLLVANYIGVFFNNAAVTSVLRWMTLYYVITTFYHIPKVILRRKIDFAFLSILEFIEAIATSFLAIVLAVYGYSYWSIVISTLSIQTLATFILIAKTRWTPRLIIGREMNDIYSFGFWNFVRAQLELLVSKVDYFFIGKYLGVYPLGLYEKSFELSDRAMSGISMPLNGVYFSTFSNIKNDTVQVRHVFLQASSLLVLITSPVLFGLIAVSPHFVYSCLGSQWKGAIVPLQLLAIGSMFRVLFGMVANVNVVMGYYRLHTIVNAFNALVFIVLCMFFVSSGINAISLVYIFYCILSLISCFCIVIKILKLTLSSFFMSVWCPFAGSLIMFLSVISLRSLFFNDYTSIMELFFLVLFGASIYACWCYFFYLKGSIVFNLKF